MKVDESNSSIFFFCRKNMVFYDIFANFVVK